MQSRPVRMTGQPENPQGGADGGRAFDPILMEVFSNRLLSITEDMGNGLVRSSFSTNIKERRDCSVGMFDARGRCVVQAAHMPMHLGSLWGSTLAVLDRFRVEDMRPGDAFICNDVFLANGTHQPDITLVTPVFWDGRVRFFVANVGHHSDVGGAVPGSVAGGARTIFEEGIRIPVLRIVRGGALDEELMYFLVSNTREPLERELDLKVQIATNRRGASMVEDLVRQMGIDAVEQAIDDLLSYTGRRIRGRIAELGDGEATFTRLMDDDGFGEGEKVRITATVRVRGERLEIDFAGTSPQGRGAMNLPPSGLHATCFYAVKTILDPSLPPNGGLFEAIDIVAPEGTIVSPRFPAATGARSITANKVAGAILGALQQLAPPARGMAASHDAVPATVFSGQRRDGTGAYVYLETIGGGAGARATHDGMDGIHVHISNTSNLPAEALEHEYPLRVDAYALVEDSCGAGTFRGGCGIARQITTLEDGVVFSVRADNHIVTAPGMNGGLDGGNARLVKNYGMNTQQELGSKVAYLVLDTGDNIRIQTGGGGGYGPPSERAPQLLAEDVRGGKVSRAKAEQDYGVEKVRSALGDG